jgi:CRP-like cAMP-binding protein
MTEASHLDLKSAARQLRDLKVFSGLTADTIDSLATATESISLAPGDVLFSQGDEADRVYFVVTGRLLAETDVSGEQRSIGTIAAGEAVGEVQLFAQERRMATVTALAASRLIALPNTALKSAAKGIEPLMVSPG